MSDSWRFFWRAAIEPRMPDLVFASTGTVPGGWNKNRPVWPDAY